MAFTDSVIPSLKKKPFLDRKLGYAFEILNYIKFPWLSKNPTTKFVIFGTGRSGSTLLVSLLNANPLIFCDNEIFHRKVFFPKRFLKCRALISKRQVYGFKLLTYQLGSILEMPGQEFLHYLTDQGYKIIYLTRENILRQALSNMYARQSKQFHQKSTSLEVERQKLKVDFATLEKWIVGIKAQRSKEASYLDGLNYLEVGYEKDLLNPASHSNTIASLSKFFDIPFEAPKTDLVKLTPDTLSGFVENYQELVSYLQVNGLAHYLASDKE